MTSLRHIICMRIVKQSFYDTFTCLAGTCPGTCCQGWDIEIDPDTLDKYRAYEGPCRQLLEEGVDYEKKSFKLLGNDRCFMLREDGLCKLVKEHGEPILCDTCHMFPRHCEEYEGIREWSVALSCPEVARIVVNGGPARFVMTEDDAPDPLEDEFDDFDLLLFTKLEDSRDLIYRIVQDRSISIYDRMGMILRLARSLQKTVDEDRVFQMDEILEKWQSYQDLYVKEEYLNSYEYINKHFHILEEVEQLNKEWSDVVLCMKQYLLRGEQIFESDVKNYERYIDTLPQKHDNILENILMSFIYTFYLGAVYDDMIYAKISMSIFFTLMIDRLALACKFIGREAKFTMFDYENIAYRFTRELEHSDNNLNDIEAYWNAKYDEEIKLDLTSNRDEH